MPCYEFQMASLPVKKFLHLVLIGMLIVIGPARGRALLTEEQNHMDLCVEAIAQKYFSDGRSLLFSVPRDVREVTGRPRVQLSYGDDLDLVNSVLQKINENMSCPVQFPADAEVTTTAETNYNYIIFIWREQEHENVIDCLRRQLDTLSDSEIQQWNPRGRFVVVVTDHNSGTPRSLAHEIYETMWAERSIFDNVVIISNSERNHLQKQMRNLSSEGTIFDLFSGFPYQRGNCGKVNEVTLMDQCIVQSNVTFPGRVNLFPPKIPKDFQNCVIRVATIGIEPFVILNKNHTRKDGTTEYDVRGFSVEFFLLSARKMNMTVVFLPPVLEITFQGGWTVMENLVGGSAEVIVGLVPMLPIIITPDSEPSIPYIHGTIKWLVPCPQAMPRVEKIITMFDASVWLAITLCFVLTSVVFWCLASISDSLAMKESNTLQTITSCMYSTWAIFVGISVTEMPKTWKTRVFFVFYVCYCFAINTVFQAFFVSYLVEPGYEDRIETFDELVESNVSYGFNSAMETGILTTDYTEQIKLFASRRIDCSDMENCIKRILQDHDIATIAVPTYAKYVANKFGTEGKTDAPCTLDENLIDGSIVVLLRRGSPILNQLNKFIRLSQEGGLVDRYWAELNSDALLKRIPESDKDGSTGYFVFSVSHTGPAFALLLCGHALSLLVCLAECVYRRIKQRWSKENTGRRRSSNLQ